jgi:glycosyltransferase involved in cell wall biosynthesis
MRVLALCSYPVEAAATRFRVAQFVGLLGDSGVSVDIKPFLDSGGFKSLYSSGTSASKLRNLLTGMIERAGLSVKTGSYDLLFVQREAMPVGPGVFEWVYSRRGRLPMVLDLDDATYVKYVSPTYGRLGSALKFFGKTDKLIDRSEVVICGNRFIAEHVEGRGKRAVVIPTIVDTDVFKPAERPNGVPVIGWIGTHSTFPFLEKLFPVLTELARRHRFVLKIVGAGREKVEVEGVKVLNLPWSLDREVEDFQSLDIGLYPIDTAGSLDTAWLAGKSGFKAIQYLAVGVPFVMTPVGVCGEIGEPGKTHFNASTDEDWYNTLDKLLSDADLRAGMGRKGRAHSLAHYRLETHAETLAGVLREVCEVRNRGRDI